MSRKRQNYMHRADASFARYIKIRDGACLACGSTEFLQCAHLISRSYKSIRTDEDNAVALCRSHHTYFTYHPLEWREWVAVRFPGRWDSLTAKALLYEKVDWKHEARYWNERVEYAQT